VWFLSTGQHPPSGGLATTRPFVNVPGAESKEQTTDVTHEFEVQKGINLSLALAATKVRGRAIGLANDVERDASGRAPSAERVNDYREQALCAGKKQRAITVRLDAFVALGGSAGFGGRSKQMVGAKSVSASDVEEPLNACGVEGDVEALGGARRKRVSFTSWREKTFTSQMKDEVAKRVVQASASSFAHASKRVVAIRIEEDGPAERTDGGPSRTDREPQP
jgi:hypothetical protein